jgi:hypothetical protein
MGFKRDIRETAQKQKQQIREEAFIAARKVDEKTENQIVKEIVNTISAVQERGYVRPKDIEKFSKLSRQEFVGNLNNGFKNGKTTEGRRALKIANVKLDRREQEVVRVFAEVEEIDGVLSLKPNGATSRRKEIQPLYSFVG